MFKAVRDGVLWNEDFDHEWSQYHLKFFDHPAIPYSWAQRLKEKRAYWREHGRRQKIPATHAIFRALIDAADDLYREQKTDPRMLEVWPKLADHLHFAATMMGHVPETPIPKDRLPDRWKSFYMAETRSQN